MKKFEKKSENEEIQFLSWEGSLSRGQFWEAFFILMIPGFIAYELAPFIQPWYYGWILNAVAVFTSLLIIFQVIKRMRGALKNPWLSLLLFVPFVNLYILYLLFIKK